MLPIYFGNIMLSTPLILADYAFEGKLVDKILGLKM
jgi:hypothetical protein